MTAAPGALVRGQDALARADWTGACGAFEEALGALPEDADALDGLGEALWWDGQWARARELREKAFTRYRAASRGRDAARVAIWLANEHFVPQGNPAAGNGRLVRAEAL